MHRELIASARKKDFKLNWFSGTGAGGQHRNKHQNCLRLTHIPSGITVTAQNSRERSANLREAFHTIKDKLVVYWLGEQHKARWPATNEVVRTYHEVDNRVTDKLSGEQLSWNETVGKQDLEKLIELRRVAMIGRMIDAH